MRAPQKRRGLGLGPEVPGSLSLRHPKLTSASPSGLLLQTAKGELSRPHERLSAGSWVGG